MWEDSVRHFIALKLTHCALLQFVNKKWEVVISDS